MDCLVINGYVTEKIGLVFDRSLRSNMDDNAAREDACGEYQSSLEDLTFNSKPHINMLTILAEENLHFAKDIVAIIEAQILKAPSQEKLPVLYLVDSIVKNVGGEYLAVFAKNLVTSFICVFEKVDENTRKSLFKLRSTWDEIFPLKKLYALDLKVNSCDPAWPVKPLPPTVNASIHVNPKFLKPAEEVVSPRASPPQLQPVPVPALGQHSFAISEASLTQEQLIRQQLLAKQKQLLELQHKKIELELEQTKAQLAGGYVLSSPPVPTAPAPPVVPPVVTNVRQPAAVVRPRVPPPQPPASQAEAKPLTRDPRINRPGLPMAHPKEAVIAKKDGQTPEKHAPEKSGRPEKQTRPPKKEPTEEKQKTKSVSPMGKGVQAKTRHPELETQKPSPDPVKKDPRIRKHVPEKSDAKEEEVVSVREKKRGVERDREESGARGSQGPQRSGARGGKMANGSVSRKHDRLLEEKSRLETGGNARTNARKRTRSRSRSRSPTSPKRKERRSPKSRSRSDSLSPSPSQKPGKLRAPGGKHAHPEDSPQHGKPREDRVAPKKTPLEPRRTKRPGEERHSEARDPHSPRGHSDGKETKENRWRSGWEESKHLKLSEESHGNAGPQRRKSYNAAPRPTTPRTPKQHRLSVDANLQIPDALNLVNKRDLLRRASKSLESGEISQEHFLNVAHQIKQLFQYQKEKQQHRSDSWEGPSDECGGPHHQQQPGPKKKTLLATPPPPPPQPSSSSSGQPQQQGDSLSDAELTYYQHKSKLRCTQLPHSRHSGGEEEWEGEEEEEQHAGGLLAESSSSTAVPVGKPGGGGGRSGPRPSAPRDREHSGRKEETQSQQTPMIEEYNHGKEFPKPKHPPGLRFKKISEPRETSEREWNSPLSERQRQEEAKSGYDAPRRYGGGGPSDPRKHERLAPKPGLVRCSPPLPGEGPYRKCLALGYERERLSPLHQVQGEMSPVPRFESPNSEHSDDGPLVLEPPRGPPPRVTVRRHGNASPGNTPPHVSDSGGHPPSRYDGGHPPRPHPGGRYEGGGRFEGPAHYDSPGRFDGPPMPHGPMRGERFDGGPPVPQGRYNGPIGQQPQERFDGQGPGPVRFDGPPVRMGGPGHFDRPIGFQQRPMRFDGPHPSQPVRPMRFDGPMHFDGSGQRYNNNNNNMGPQGMAPLPRFDGPPRYMQPQLRPLGLPMFEGPGGPQPQQQPSANFNNQRFPEALQPQFGGAPPMPFPGQQNAPQGGNFNVPPGQPQPGFPNTFNQPGPQFYGNMNAQSAIGPMQQQPMNMMPNHQPFLPPNPVPFNHSAPQFPPAESHFRQVDVDDLLSSLVLTGIIKAPSSGPGARLDAPRAESAILPPVPPAVEVEEEEEEEEEDDDVADLTAFIVEDMKQRYESVVTKLYTGIQCYSCGMRFTASQTDVYADHLDWHYRQNRSEKDISKKVTHRRWYYSLTDWIEFEEIADLEERAKSMFFEKVNEEVVQKTQEAAKEKEFQSVKAAADVVDESCEICQEPFENYWEEEEEEWHLKNAIRVDGATYHPSCFEDYKNTSPFMDTTPSPSKLLTENPLSAFVKREEEEERPSCCTVVKQEEEEEEVCETESVKKEEVELQDPRIVS
ncbi:pre-mRNA cleavage complex 2 protein Pcf11 [Aplochiton taeniatus]